MVSPFLLSLGSDCFDIVGEDGVGLMLSCNVVLELRDLESRPRYGGGKR